MDVLKALGVSIADIEKNSETDVEHKLTVPYLEKILGYTKENGVVIKFRVARPVPVGSRFETIIPDIAIYVDDKPFLLIDSKPINKTITPLDANEAVSNGRLYEFPQQFPYSIVSTGLKWEIYATLTGVFLGDHEAVPDVHTAKQLLSKGLPLVSPEKKHEAERLLETRKLIQDRKSLQALFKECKKRIEVEGKRGIAALSEISKIILVKIYEEEFSIKDKRQYRFSTVFLDEQQKAFPQKTRQQSLTNYLLKQINTIALENLKEFFQKQAV